jgi:hypothetical protein
MWLSTAMKLTKPQLKIVKLALRQAIEWEYSILDAYSFPLTADERRKYMEGLDEDLRKYLNQVLSNIRSFQKLLKRLQSPT